MASLKKKTNTNTRLRRVRLPVDDASDHGRAPNAEGFVYDIAVRTGIPSAHFDLLRNILAGRYNNDRDFDYLQQAKLRLGILRLEIAKDAPPRRVR